MTPRAVWWWSACALLGCGDLGHLHPFADGSASASDGGSGTAAEASGTAGDTDGNGDPGGLLYVRCPRTQAALEVTADVTVDGELVSATRTFHHTDVYDVLPSATGIVEMVAPCDLVLRDAYGSESVIFDCTSSATDASTCAAIDPAVSHDGKSIAFAVVYGAIGHHSENVDAQALNPAADPGNASTGATVPNPALAATRGEIHVVELDSGSEVIAAGAADELRRQPSFLHDGRVMFTASVAGSVGTLVREGGGQAHGVGAVIDVHVMSADGRELERLGTHTMTSNQAPLQLVDGRVAVVSTQRVGLLPYRYNNGSPGTAGADANVHHVYAEDPDGARFTALFGQHTHLLVGAFEHSHANGLGQLGDGRLVFVEGAGTSGAGTLRAFAPDPDGLEGPAPHTADPADVFRPTDLVELTPWAGSGGGFSAVMPAPAVVVPGYADPLAYAGFVRDPVGEPDGGMILVWTKGACSNVASNDPSLYGDPPPPATSGAYGLVPLNTLEWLGRDNPGCDAGIYRASTTSTGHPAELEVVIDSPAFHELMPKVVRPFAAVHGQATPTPIEPAHRRAAPSDALPVGTPFALLGGSSLLQHETRSFDGNPFGSEHHWALQGAQTSDFVADDVCAVRITALMPNVPDDFADLLQPLGHRAFVLAEVPVRKFSGGAPVLDPLGDPDTSFRLRVPADTPLLVGGLDCEGRSLSSSQVPFSLRPGEDRTCGGCHVRSQLPLRFDETAAASAPPLLAGDGTVQLVAGGSGEDVVTAEVDGFGVAFEFDRDVWPILQARCVECHATDAAMGGLRLDVPGVDPGSTWWRLVADFPQADVAPAQQSPAGVLRKPQLSRYVRFFAARGSLLYWKAANARTDGRTDATFGDGPEQDIDFGADHPSAITPDELRTLARWIDTGAAAGPAAFADTAGPVLVLRIDGDAPDVLVVGTVDVGVGVDATSLAMAWSADGLTWTEIVGGDAAEAGVVMVDLAGVPGDALVRASVQDLAGNATTVVRGRLRLQAP